MEYVEHGQNVHYYGWSINDSPGFRLYLKLVVYLSLSLGMNIKPQIGVQRDLGNTEVVIRIIQLDRRGRRCQEPTSWGNI
jgi:hypothetical protein